MYSLSMGMGRNPAIESNELGDTATACARIFCSTKDSLDLWLSIEYRCHAGSSVGDSNSDMQKSTRRLSEISRKISAFRAGMICAVFTALGIGLGITISR